jgi:methionyl-tRNA synthetase
MNNYYAVGLGALTWIPLFGPVLLILALWSIFWKGLALWHSAQRGQYWWFCVLLVVNTVGILEIIYLFAVAKLKFSTLFTSKR